MSEIAISDSRELAMVDEEQLVTFMVDGQAFGIPILMVQDIVEPDQITPVPLAPGAIAGVLNLRGRIVTVIDMRELLHATEFDEGAKQMSVTVEYKGDLYTFLVDSIGDVRSLPRKSFDKPPSTLSENLRRLCSGIFRLEGDLLVVLDVDRMLDEETIMATPRRTRKRRLASKDLAANQNADAEIAEEEEDISAKKPEGASKVSPKKVEKAVGAKSSKKASKPKAVAKAAAKVEEPVMDEPEVEDAPTVEHAVVADSDSQAMQAVEIYASKVDGDPILNDLFKSINDSEMLDLLVNLFNAAFGNKGAPTLESAYLKFIQQPGLGDDHFISAGTAMHGTLMDVHTDAPVVDRIMQVIDETRIKVLDI